MPISTPTASSTPVSEEAKEKLKEISELIKEDEEMEQTLEHMSPDKQRNDPTGFDRDPREYTGRRHDPEPPTSTPGDIYDFLRLQRQIDTGGTV